jgi:two-component system, OmpR family, sensor histidine kinase VicK
MSSTGKQGPTSAARRDVILSDVTAQRAAQRQLEEAEARYRALVEQMQAVLYIDLAGEEMNSIYVSPQIEAILGVTPDEYLADPAMWERMLHPEDRERTVHGYFDYLHRVSDGSGPMSEDDEYRMIRPDGRVVWIYDQATALRDEDGAPSLIQGVMFDIIDRKEAEHSIRKSEAALRATIESTADGIQAESDDALLAFVLDQLKDPERFLLKVRELYRSDREDFDTLLFKDGRVFERYSRPLVNGGEIGGRVWSFRDVTEREEAGRRLREAYEQEREAAQQLRALNEMKNTFLSAVSHELRTPLSAVLGLALTLQREDMALPPEESQELLDRLAANARKLERLLSDLLDLDRLSRGIVEPRRRLTDIGALVRGTLEGSDLFGRRRMQVDAESVVIPVDDAGPGVPEEMRERIFEPFQQGPGTPSYSPGVGIGLSLVARFAELHGGRAWVEERPGGGASFRVFLPGEASAEPNGHRTGPGVAGPDASGHPSEAGEGRR